MHRYPQLLQKRVPDILELELQSLVSCPPWALDTKHRSSGRAVLTLNHRQIP